MSLREKVNGGRTVPESRLCPCPSPSPKARMVRIPEGPTVVRTASKWDQHPWQGVGAGVWVDQDDIKPPWFQREPVWFGKESLGGDVLRPERRNENGYHSGICLRG